MLLLKFCFLAVKKKKGQNYLLKPGREELVAYDTLLLPKDLTHRLAAKATPTEKFFGQ